MDTQSVQASLPHWMSTVAFVLHIGGGTLGLMSGLTAAFTRKGSRVHRGAGALFTVSMLIMAAAAAYLAVVRPGQLPNLIIAAMVFYLVVTAWLAAHRRDGEAPGLPEKAALAWIVCLCIPFAILSFFVAIGRGPAVVQGPVVIAVYVFTAIVTLAALADARMILRGGVSGAARIARHLWRMCFALALAAGSFFTNAVPKFLHIPFSNWLFLPQLLVLLFLLFWLIRVGFTGWWKAAETG
jgi:hypothetical protein